MKKENPSSTRHLVIFFLLTYGLAWLLWIPAAVMGQTNQSLLYLLGGFAPSIIGIIMVYRTYEPEQRHNFWRRIIDFRWIQPGWYALIFLTFPLLYGISIVLNALLGGDAPGVTQLQKALHQPIILIPTLILGLVAGPLSEELGWRGYALDQMLSRWSLFLSSVVMGLIWWPWHWPLFFIRGEIHYIWGWGTPLFWLNLVNIVALSIFIAWAYERNNRSILAAVLIHFMSNFTPGLFTPFSGEIRFIETILLCILVTVLVLVDKKQTVPVTVAS